MELWRFQRRLTSLLLGWAAASIGTGLVLWRGGEAPFLLHNCRRRRAG